MAQDNVVCVDLVLPGCGGDFGEEKIVSVDGEESRLVRLGASSVQYGRWREGGGAAVAVFYIAATVNGTAFPTQPRRCSGGGEGVAWPEQQCRALMNVNKNKLEEGRG